MGPASSTRRRKRHSHFRGLASSAAVSLLDGALSVALSVSLPASERTSNSETRRGTAKSSRLGGKKSMTRTVAREQMFWKGRV